MAIKITASDYNTVLERINQLRQFHGLSNLTLNSVIVGKLLESSDMTQVATALTSTASDAQYIPDETVAVPESVTGSLVKESTWTYLTTKLHDFGDECPNCGQASYSQSTSYSESFSKSNSESASNSVNPSNSVSYNRSTGYSQRDSRSSSYSQSYSQSNNKTTMSDVCTLCADAYRQSNSISTSYSESDSRSTSYSESDSRSTTYSKSTSYSDSYSQSNSRSTSYSQSTSYSNNSKTFNDTYGY